MFIHNERIPVLWRERSLKCSSLDEVNEWDLNEVAGIGVVAVKVRLELDEKLILEKDLKNCLKVVEG
jgi:hypothetical protein